VRNNRDRLILLAILFSCQPPTHKGRPCLRGRHTKRAVHLARLIVTNLDASVRWYQSSLGLHEINEQSRRVSCAKQAFSTGHSIFVDLIHYSDRPLARRQIDDTTPVAGSVKTGAIISAGGIGPAPAWTRRTNGVFSDKEIGVRSFIVRDNDRNMLQFFAYG
jgi:catechol 2,3-dioxygenase-like lactoylglutathione lyase family enzyme